MTEALHGGVLLCFQTSDDSFLANLLITTRAQMQRETFLYSAEAGSRTELTCSQFKKPRISNGLICYTIYSHNDETPKGTHKLCRQEGFLRGGGSWRGDPCEGGGSSKGDARVGGGSLREVIFQKDIA